jgi:hypothetical protein
LNLSKVYYSEFDSIDENADTLSKIKKSYRESAFVEGKHGAFSSRRLSAALHRTALTCGSRSRSHAIEASDRTAPTTLWPAWIAAPAKPKLKIAPVMKKEHGRADKLGAAVKRSEL